MSWHAARAGVRSGGRGGLTLSRWRRCSYFSSLVNTYATRQKLAKDMLAFVNKYGADGIDLDWEYPNSQVRALPLRSPLLAHRAAATPPPLAGRSASAPVTPQRRC